MHLNIENDKSIKILVVEDESIIALDITQKLRNLGFNPLKPVNTGEKAIRSVEENRPDLIILDIKLKGDMDGIETAAVIKKKKSVPFIFFSAFHDRETLERVKMTEPYGYIPKSSNNIDLYTTVKIALQRFSIEKAFHRREELFSATMRSITDAVLGVNGTMEILFWNSGAEKMFGWKESEVQGMDISLLTPSFIPNEFPEIIEKIIRKGRSKNFDAVLQHKNGTIISVSMTLSPIWGLGGEYNGFSLVIKDISERKELEKQIIDILEEERFRIGQELHDNLGQYLTGILLKLKVLENELSKKNLSEQKDLAVRISSHVRESLKKTREISRGLVTLGLENVTLSDALQDVISYFSNIKEVTITFISTIDNEVRNHRIIAQLYHIAQESVTNALKHSGGSVIKIILTSDETEIIMRIVDNGRGIGSEKKKRGLGLKIMKYRAGMIHGRLCVYSKKGSGTTVLCSIPKAVIEGLQ